jgi:C4-dicarboxylate-specific signal transduction histidine kinase
MGVLEFYSHDMRQPDHDLLQMLAGIGSQIGQFTERTRAEQALRDLAAQLEEANRTLERRVAERTAQLAQANAESLHV